MTLFLASKEISEVCVNSLFFEHITVELSLFSHLSMWWMSTAFLSWNLRRSRCQAFNLSSLGDFYLQYLTQFYRYWTIFKKPPKESCYLFILYTELSFFLSPRLWTIWQWPRIISQVPTSQEKYSEFFVFLYEQQYRRTSDNTVL